VLATTSRGGTGADTANTCEIASGIPRTSIYRPDHGRQRVRRPGR
jgi:hypothetical protein